MTKTMSKNADNRPGRKVRKRIRLKFDVMAVTQYLIIAVATVLVVAIGVFVPAFVLRKRSAPENLPSGHADIAEVQLYGAAYKRSEQGLDDALNGYYGFVTSYGSRIDLSSMPSRDIALYSNGYSQIGISDSGSEFFYEFTGVLEEETGFDIPEEIEVRDISEDVVLVGGFSGNYDYFVLDTTSGVPVSGHAEFLSDYGGGDLPQFFYQIVELYNDFTGLDFMIEPYAVESGTDYYRNSIMTTDDEFILSVEITRSIFYPVGEGPNAQARYLWIIDVDLYNTDGVDYIMSAA